MRIHSDTLTNADVYDAARTARVSFDRWEGKGSRKRDHAFDVTLFGESRRRPNNRQQHTDDYAATWDQWGVFLAVLFDRDPNMVTPYYADADEFHARTGDRFRPRKEIGRVRTFIGIDDIDGPVLWWPADAHGDHTFRYSGTAGKSQCTKCSAVQKW